jgi:hypothetical protein
LGTLLLHLTKILLLAAHMLAHLAAVVGIVFAEDFATVTRILGDMVEVLLEVREALLEVVAVRGAEVLGYETVVDACSLLVVGTIVVKSVDIAYRKEEMVVDIIVAANLFDGLFAKSQRNAKPRQHKD